MRGFSLILCILSFWSKIYEEIVEYTEYFY